MQEDVIVVSLRLALMSANRMCLAAANFRAAKFFMFPLLSEVLMG